VRIISERIYDEKEKKKTEKHRRFIELCLMKEGYLLRSYLLQPSL